MLYKCDLCEKKIPCNSTLYFGFDSRCCSDYCRVKIIELHIKIDPLMTKPHLWLKNKLQPMKIPESVIPKIQSLSDMISNFKIY